MRRLLVGAVATAVLVATGLPLATGPARLVGSSNSDAGLATPSGCTAPRVPGDGEPQTVATSDMAGMGDMHGATGSGAAIQAMEELRGRLARTPSGGTVTFGPGVFRGALVIDHPVTLVGLEHPILQGDGTATVLTIRAPGTVVRDFMVEGSGPGPVGNPAGVLVEADHVVVKHLHIRDTFMGVRIEGVGDAQVVGSVIEGRATSAVSGESSGEMAGMPMGSRGGGAPATAIPQATSGDGVSLWNAAQPVVTGNVIAHARDGVYLSYGSGARIECNSVVGGRYAVHSMYAASLTAAGNRFVANLSGAVMMYGGPVELGENVIRDERSGVTGFGVLLLDVGGVRLDRNVIVGNRVGLQIEGPQDNSVTTAAELNTIALNQVGVALYPTAHAVLSQNSFAENTVQVLGLGPDGGGGDSRWSRDGVGNYWSDYRGFEGSRRGVGDFPHVEGGTAARLLASDPTLLAFASSPAFRLLRAVDERWAGQRPVVVDRFPLVDPRSLPLPTTAGHAALSMALLGATAIVISVLDALRWARHRRWPSER